VEALSISGLYRLAGKPYIIKKHYDGTGSGEQLVHDGKPVFFSGDDWFDTVTFHADAR